MTDTRDRIIQATIRLFNRYGPLVSMAQICEEAGVATGTPFRHFKTKDELLAAAYQEARLTTLRLVPQEDFSTMSAEQSVKSIVHTIMTWAVLCPQDLEYMRKYEDSICYDCFSERFSEELYVGVVRETNLWEKLREEVREDLPEEFVNRLISINCSLYSRYVMHKQYRADSEEFQRFMEASADSIWNSIRRQDGGER